MARHAVRLLRHFQEGPAVRMRYRNLRMQRVRRRALVAAVIGDDARQRVARHGQAAQPAQSDTDDLHDPNAIDVLRLVISVSFPGAGPATKRQRRDAKFPRGEG
jgi:hypothetical protein